MDPATSDQARPHATDEQFMRLFLESERELLRYVMVLIPNVHDARDVLQEAAVSLWRAAEKYDPARPFVPWACRFVLNEARMFLRGAARRRRFIEEDVAVLLDSQRLEMAEGLKARREHLRECLRELPEQHRELVRGYYFDDETIESLARRQGRGSEAVYKALQRIRQTLHHCMQRKQQATS